MRHTLRTPLASGHEQVHAQHARRLIGALLASLLVSAEALARQAPPADAPTHAPTDAPTHAPAVNNDQAARSDRAPRNQPLPPDWPRAGGFGAASERPMIEGLVAESINGPMRARRELTDDDVMRAIEVAKEVAPSWGQALQARAQEDMEQFKMALRGRARRLLELLALKERAPVVYQAKITELRAQADTERAAAELRAAEHDASVTAEKLTQLRAGLDDAARKQVDATLAARRAELVALDERLTQLRGKLDADATIAAELALEVKAHANLPREQSRGGERGPDRDDNRKPPREPAPRD